MKVRLSMLGISLVLGMAVAQTPPPDQPTRQQQTQPQTQPQMQQQTQQQTPAGQQGDMKSNTPAGTLAEMKTATFKGVLVDMSCASKTAGTTSTPTKSPDEAKSADKDKANTADRAAGDAASCPVSANSTEIGMKLEDGRTVRFDLVGNQRAQDALKNNKRWNKDLSANKPIKAKVSGVMQGEKLIVASIN